MRKNYKSKKQASLHNLEDFMCCKKKNFVKILKTFFDMF